MGDFGILRQYAEKDLLGLLVRPITNFDHAKFEQIEPEWTEGGYFSSKTNTTSNASMRYAVVDCTKYDYVLCGVSSEISGSVFSGIRLAADSGSMQNFVNFDSSGCSGYALFDLTTNKYLMVSQSITYKVPIIGIILN